MLILRPCHGGEAAVDVNVVALKLQPLIDARKKTDEWDIDAFGSSRTDRVDTREIEEAVDFNQTDSNVDEENSDQRAEQNLMNCFFRRRDGLSSAIESAKSFVTGLDCLLSISRYIYRGEPTQGSWREINRNVARRVERADKAIDELRILYARTHWQGTQSEASVVNTSLSDLEDFVAVATDRSLKAQLVDHLLQHAARVKEGSNTVASNGVPVRFIDPLSGDIFVDPVRATDGFVYERRCIESWRNVYGTSPLDPTIDIDADSPLISVGSLLQPILAFLRGRPRAFFRARQRPFLIQIGTGGGRARLFVTLPGTVSVLSILFDEWSFSERRPSTSRLWHGLRDYGDGSFRGRALEPITSLHDLSAYVESIGSDDRVSVNTLDLDLRAWHYIATGAERTRIDSRSMSRLDVVKQAFEAFINKSEAFDHPIAVGLVTFGRRVTEVQEVTLPKEQFRDTLKSVKADGDTPLFDGLAVAHSMLTRFKHQHPSTALRIICLTDGFDIGSNVSANAVAARLQQTGIIVDSIVVQTGRLTNVLHPISVVTGGYSFKVDTLENALNIVELETVLRAKDRVERPPKPIVRHQWHLSKYNDLWTYPMDVVTAEKCPDRKLHERLCEPLQSAHKAAARSAPPSSTDRQRRLMQEVRDIVNSPHPAIDVYVGDDLAFWKIVIEAPEGSPYEGGTFLAYIDFGGDYPQAAPEVRFITPILHPNINRHGKVCHAALDRNWLVDMTINVVLQILYGILLTPDTDNPLELHATMEYNDDGGNHALKVHDMVKKFAAKNREAWRKELEEIDSTNKD
ncbi:hypothetical protein AcV5_009939 [Taiwanofungus camphoratus]|nr:hypothetical protein AcV5_009939 [Antrodia cinnamomea]KAI0945809.1 hypothetical protein AcV7_009947 [Antrodia cinnamomea]